MRFLAFTMAFLVLFLSAGYCADEGIAHVNSSEQVLAHDAESANPFSDCCSPFCHCTCCAGFSINHQLIFLPVVVKLNTSHHAVFTSEPVLEVSFTFWQPPRV